MKRMSSVVLVLTLSAIPVPLGMPVPAVASDAAQLVSERVPAARKPTPDEARSYVAKRATRSGYSTRQVRCLMTLLHRESRFRVDAASTSSSAYGLFQQLKLKPGTPMHKQVTQGLKYLAHRYPTDGACEALRHSDRLGWY